MRKGRLSWSRGWTPWIQLLEMTTMMMRMTSEVQYKNPEILLLMFLSYCVFAFLLISQFCMLSRMRIHQLNNLQDCSACIPNSTKHFSPLSSLQHLGYYGCLSFYPSCIDSLSLGHALQSISMHSPPVHWISRPTLATYLYLTNICKACDFHFYAQLLLDYGQVMHFHFWKKNVNWHNLV